MDLGSIQEAKASGYWGRGEECWTGTTKCEGGTTKTADERKPAGISISRKEWSFVVNVVFYDGSSGGDSCIRSGGGSRGGGGVLILALEG